MTDSAGIKTADGDRCAARRSMMVWAGWRHLWAPIDHLGTIVSDAATDAPEQEHEFSGVWELIRREYPDLVAVSPRHLQKWSLKATRGLMLDIKSAAPPGRAFSAQRRVSEVIEAGKNAGRWDIPLADVPAPLPPAPASPFQHRAFVAMVQHEPLFQALRSCIGTDITPDDQEAYWGRIIASALLYGGLLQARWLLALPESLANAEAHCGWIELYQHASDDTRPMHTRWYPDPVTRYLLVQAQYQGAIAPLSMRRSGPNVYRMIRACCRRLGIAEHLPRRWGELHLVVRTRLALYLPPYLLAHASGVCSATSLPPGRHLRNMMEGRIQLGLASQQPSRPESADPGAGSSLENESNNADSPDEDVGYVDHSALWPAQLRELTVLIRQSDPPDRANIEAWLAQGQSMAGEPLLPSVMRIGEWVAHWLCRTRHKRRKPRRRTVYERYNAVAGRIVGQLGDIDPASFDDAEDFVELYGNALEDSVSLGSRKRIAKGLQSLHAFMVDTYGAPQDLGDLLHSSRYGRSRGAPDAYYLDPVRFERAMDWIELFYRREPRKALLLRLLASFGFYAGLRRSEAAGLLAPDLEDAHDHELVIRANENRGLKSANARRTLPLGVLLPETTLQRLVEWKEYRCQMIRDAGSDPAAAPLFTLRDATRLRDNDPIFDDLTHRLIEATGDSGIRYHHLRHSFASRLIVQCWQAEQAESVNKARPPWATNIGAMDPAHIRTELLGQSPVQRRSLRLVARMMGHADVRLTVEHYIHTLDDLLGRSVRRLIDDMPTEEIAGITGYSASHVRAVRRETRSGNAADTLDLITDRQLPKQDRPSRIEPEAKHQDSVILRVESPKEPVERLLVLTGLINERHDGGVIPDSGEYPWSNDLVEKYLARAWTLPAGMRRRLNRVEDIDRVIDAPRTQAEKALARRAYTCLHGAPNSDEVGVSRRYREALLASYQCGWRPGRLITLRCNRVADLRRWVWLLNELDLVTEYEGRHTPAPDSEAGSPNRQRVHWQDKGLLITAADLAQFPPDSDAGSRGYVTVMPAPGQKPSTAMNIFGLLWILTLSVLHD